MRCMYVEIIGLIAIEITNEDIIHYGNQFNASQH